MRLTKVRGLMLTLGLAAIFVAAAGSGHAREFRGLGDLPGGEHRSQAYAVSADGKTVVGFSQSESGREAFRWTREGGLQSLGDLPGGEMHGEARAVSADGAVIVGTGTQRDPDKPFAQSGGCKKCFLWAAREGLRELGSLRADVLLRDSAPTRAVDLSADGSVVVGVNDDVGGRSVAFIWTQEKGCRSLTVPSAAPFEKQAALRGHRASILGADFVPRAISGDGTTVVGQFVARGINDAYACLWRDGKIERILSKGLAEGVGDASSWTVANAVSGNGEVVAGVWGKKNSNQRRGFRWTRGSFAWLEHPTGPKLRQPIAISGDGRFVGGIAEDGDWDGAGIWDPSHGARRLTDLLTALGVHFGAWKLNAVVGISRDGTAIVGDGVNPSGEAEAWIVTLKEGDLLQTATAGLSRPDDALAVPLPEPSPEHVALLGPDLARMQGKWKLKTINGERIGREPVVEFRLDRLLRQLPDADGYLVNADEQLTLNAKTEPKQLDTKDLALGGLGGEMLGIFRLEGDRLTWCQAGSGQERPSEFAPDKRTRTDVLVYRRLPAEKPAKLPPVEDLFASKSVWAGEVRWPVIKSAKVGMRIESRDGNKFKGFMMGFPPMTKGELSVSGEIAGNAVTLTWQARDASQSIACRRVGGLLVGDYPMDNVRTARLELEYGKSLF